LPFSALAKAGPSSVTIPPVNISLVQLQVTRGKDANVERGLAALEAAARDGAELVVFPELAFEWFHPQRPAGANPLDLAEPVPGPTTERFQRAARSLGVAVVLNLYERDGDRAYDCSPVIDADGTLVGRTRMVHITEYPCFHEQGYYTPGDTGAPVYRTKAGKVGVAICYDRHYPEYMRALALAGAEVVVVPQAGAVGEWPEGLYEAEMRVAAFQNGYFTALCNRVGKEDRLDFAGESFVCGPDGEVIARAPKSADAILYADIDLSETAKSNARRLFMKHRRPHLYADWLAR
jgi:beta-ureidopropionase